MRNVVDRAGGLASDAYPAGISFIRQRDTIGGLGIDLPSALPPSAPKNRNDRAIAGDHAIAATAADIRKIWWFTGSAPGAPHNQSRAATRRAE